MQGLHPQPDDWDWVDDFPAEELAAIRAAAIEEEERLAQIELTYGEWKQYEALLHKHDWHDLAER